jgi:hypothetical protein
MYSEEVKMGSLPGKMGTAWLRRDPQWTGAFMGEMMLCGPEF